MGDLKRSCDACVTSKVKCSGTQPCTRCETRHIDCFYRARKKRAPPSSSPAAAAAAASASSVDNQHQVKQMKSQVSALKDQTYDLLRQTAPKYLPAHERLSWLVFFTLYKNYRAGCSRLWFERQLGRLSQRLSQEQNHELLTVFQLWTKSMDVDFPDRITNKYLGCMRALADRTSAASALACQGSVHFHVPGSVCPALPGQVAVGGGGEGGADMPVPPSLEEMKRVFMSNYDNVAHLTLMYFGDYPNDGVHVQVNSEFTKQFGLTQQQIQAGCVMGSGLLPWGGDMLCWMVPNEADVFAYMQVCALNFTWSALRSLPCVRMVPSTHMVAVRIASHQVVPCLIKCIHRETIDLESGMGLEICMTFEPIASQQQQQPLPLQHTPVTSDCHVHHFHQDRDHQGHDLYVFDTSYLPMADGGEGHCASGGEAAFPPFNLESVEDDAAFLQDLLDFARQEGI